MYFRVLLVDNVTKTVKYLLWHLTRTTHSSPLPLFSRQKEPLILAGSSVKTHTHAMLKYRLNLRLRHYFWTEDIIRSQWWLVKRMMVMKLFANSNIEIYTHTKIHKLRQRGTNWSSILEAKELTFGIEDEFQSMLEGKVRNWLLELRTNSYLY